MRKNANKWEKNKSGKPLEFSNIHVRFNQTALAIGAALEGHGIALANRAFVARDLAAGRVVHHFAQTFDTGAGFYPVHSRKQQHIPRRWRLCANGGISVRSRDGLARESRCLSDVCCRATKNAQYVTLSMLR